MPLLRGLACAVLITSCASVLRGQTSSLARTQDSSDVLVLDHAFSSPDEMVRVFLQDAQVYRAEVSSPGVLLQIRGVVRTIQPPQVYPFLSSQTPSGTTLVEIYPEADAVYEIRSLGITLDGSPPD